MISIQGLPGIVYREYMGLYTGSTWDSIQGVHG